MDRTIPMKRTDPADYAELAAAVRDADEDVLWNAFGRDIQRTIIDRRDGSDDGLKTVVGLSVTGYVAHEETLLERITPAKVWAVKDTEKTSRTLADYGYIPVTFTAYGPYIQHIRPKVADALESAAANEPDSPDQEDV